MDEILNNQSIDNSKQLAPVEVEIVDGEGRQSSTQSLEVLEKVEKYTAKEVLCKENIQQNMQMAFQRKKEILNQNYQFYVDDIQYKNQIIESHNHSLSYAKGRGIQFWRSNTDSNIYYRSNPYSKRKKLNSPNELYSALGVHVHIYDTLDKVQLFDLGTNALLFVSEWFTKIEGDMFSPFDDSEWLMYNNLQYKNTFQYSIYLQKRNIPQQIEQIRNNINQQIVYAPMQFLPQMQPQQPQLFSIFPSVSNNFFPLGNTENQIAYLESQLKTYDSSIENFIQAFSKDDEQFDYIMHWLARFFQTLNKSSRALVLIGDTETTDIFINQIIKPIFAYKNEYMCTINDTMLKKKQEDILKDRIFYHLDTDNLSNDNAKTKSTNQLLLQILKSNISGELIITSSKDSPYPYLKDIYSRCSVLQVKSMDTILKQFNIDRFTLEDAIKNDLDNFARILTTDTCSKEYYTILNNPEKDVLSSMKNGILMTPELDNNINTFISNIRKKNLNYFINIQSEDGDLYHELKDNFDANMIAQPLLSQYFNLVYSDVFFLENAHLLEILKEKDSMFSKAPDDKSKYNGKKRYEIS